jgi:hypothetical protein
MELAKIDLSPSHRQESLLRVGAATIVALIGSLLADASIVAIGTRVFPSTKGYGHFHFSDYGKTFGEHFGDLSVLTVGGRQPKMRLS